MVRAVRMWFEKRWDGCIVCLCVCIQKIIEYFILRPSSCSRNATWKEEYWNEYNPPNFAFRHIMYTPAYFPPISFPLSLLPTCIWSSIW
jgi:hypothetical protein